MTEGSQLRGPTRGGPFDVEACFTLQTGRTPEFNCNAGRRKRSSRERAVVSVDDSYDNALAETVIGLYMTEVIRRRGPWRNIDAVKYATLEWVDWFNNRRLLEPIGHVPPAEYEKGVLSVA